MFKRLNTQKSLSYIRADHFLLQQHNSNLQKDLESYQDRLNITSTALHNAKIENHDLRLKNTMVGKGLEASQEEVSYLRSIPLELEELLEEQRTECIELRKLTRALIAERNKMENEQSVLRYKLDKAQKSLRSALQDLKILLNNWNDKFN